MKKISALIISMALLFSTSVMGVSAKETVETKELYAAEQGETKKESAKENTNAEKISVASDSPVELKVINSWSDLKNEIESATTDKTISISGILEKTSSDERVTIPAGLHIVLMSNNATIIRPGTSTVGEFLVADNAALTLQGNLTVEAKGYQEDKGSLSHANFVEVNAGGHLSLDGQICAHTSDGFFNGRYGTKGFIYCKGNMDMSDKASVSGWTVYDTTRLSDNRNAAVVLDGTSAKFTMNGGEITGNYNVGSNGVAGASVQVHDGSSFIMNNGSIHHNGVIDNPKSNVHYGSGVFVYDANSSFKMTGGTINDNNGMVGVGVYVYGSSNGKASFEMTGGKIENNIMTNWGKYACDGGGIYAKYADINIETASGNTNISISGNGTNDFGSDYYSPQSSGGGIYAEKSTVNLKNVSIRNNTACGNNAQGGAGIWLEDSDASIIGGDISNNQGGKKNQNVWGGGLRVSGTGNVLVKEVSFTGNAVSPESDYEWNIGYGGAIMMDGEGTLTLEDCTIKNNHASASGGGIYANQGTIAIKGNTILEGNTCNNNRDEWNDYLGEAICITPSATVTLYDHVIIDKNNTVGLEEYKGEYAVLTIGNQYTGIDTAHPIAIESMSRNVEMLPDTKGTPLVIFTDEAGGAAAAQKADENLHFIASTYMPERLFIGQSAENNNTLTYVANRPPVINAEDKIISVGDNFDPLANVTATDKEDGVITLTVNNVIKNEVNTSVAGTYSVTYQVTDSMGLSSTKTITVTVNPKLEELNHVPTINGNDKTFMVGDEFNEEIALKDITAWDDEDKDITSKIEVLSHNVDTTKAGEYQITYKVTDSKGASTTKTIKVLVEEKKLLPPTSDNDTPNMDGNNNVNTGDSTELGFYVLIAAISGLLVTFFIVVNRKNLKKNKSE